MGMVIEKLYIALVLGVISYCAYGLAQVIGACG